MEGLSFAQSVATYFTWPNFGKCHKWLHRECGGTRTGLRKSTRISRMADIEFLREPKRTRIKNPRLLLFDY